MSNTIFASMRYRDAAAAIDWLERAFGLRRHVVHTDPEGAVTHAELAYGEGLVMLGQWRGEADPRHPGQGWAYVVVGDLDAHHAHAVAAGADVSEPPLHEEYGSFYGARDPEGNLWSFGTYRPGFP